MKCTGGVPLVILVVAALSAGLVSAAPYYYFFADPVPAAPEANAPQQAQQTAGQLQEAAKAAGQEQTQQAPSGGSNLKEHLSSLYNHGSSAVRGVVDTVQPDIKNIGQDLSEVYKQTRTQVGKRIEPLAQTVRPYIDHAEKVVSPYLNKAREEVPKALSSVSSFVRSKISGDQQQEPIQQQHVPVEQLTKQATEPIKEVAQQAQQLVNKQ